MPELEEILLGEDAFRFDEYEEDSALVLRGNCMWRCECIDLPALTTLVTVSEESRSFAFPHTIVLEGSSGLWLRA